MNIPLKIIYENEEVMEVTFLKKENIILPLKLAGKIIDEEDFKQIIKDLEIDDLLDKYPFECSGGQSQRVAVARTLVMHPKIIFADEPTGNLDGVRSKQLMQYLEKVNREKNITVIMVTHDPLDAAYSSQMYYIEDGKIKDHLLKKMIHLILILIRLLSYQWNYKILKRADALFSKICFFSNKVGYLLILHD